MRLDRVMDEIAQALEEITGLRVSNYPAPTIVPPAGYVSYPREIAFDETYDRGADEFTDLPIVLLSSNVTTRTARNTVAKWSAGDGPGSVKAAVEARQWTSCDDVTVTACTFDTEKIGAVTYLAVLFKATVVGSGKED